ncbi:MAG TPA: rhamnogalacturonan acetylesterase [Candidatus Sulfopaludibacter sp.]|nr:rhamnogalacturonan acetylesterase [Candidatus Sulfopaludibacter sp.]
MILFFVAGLSCVAGRAQTVKIVLVGDSTVNDEGGWGPGFRASLDSHVEVINLAKNGRSSKSFRAEGLWAPALAAKPDYILIQFGHNDVPGKGEDRETVAATTYRENMARYLAEARAAGAIPILVTSIVRRNFTPEGKIVADSLVPYVEAVRKLAAEQNVPLLDLYSLTLAQAEKLGPAGCEEINAVDKAGKSDHTHLGPKGRQEIGLMAAREFVKAAPKLKPWFTGNL